MKKIPGARFIVYRTNESSHSMRGEFKAVGMVNGGKVHAISGTPGSPLIQRKGRPLETVEILRDATPREVALGMALHS